MNFMRHIFFGIFFGTGLTTHAATQADISIFRAQDYAFTIILTILVGLLISCMIKLRRIQGDRKKHKTFSTSKKTHPLHMSDHLPGATVFQLQHSKKSGFKFTELTKEFEQSIGLNRELVLKDAKLAYDSIYKEDLPLLINAFQNSSTNLTPITLELRAHNTSDQLRWLRISAIPHQEQDSMIWNGFMLDVSQVKLAEDALVEENINFKNLFENIDDFLIIFDMDGQLLHCNRSITTRLGYSLDELLDMSIFELYTEEPREKIYRAVATMRLESSTTNNQPLLTAIGTTIPVDMTMLRGSWKKEKAIFAMARDVAGRQETENALHESQKMLQLIMDTIPMAVFWKNKDSVYLGGNKTFVNECGFESLKEVVGKTPRDLFDPILVPDVMAQDQEVIRNNKPIFNFQQSYALPDEGIGWREINKIPLRNEEGQAVGVLGVWRDVTEQNFAAERLKRTLEDMERFNQLMRGRERRTLELKAEINTLLKELNKPIRYRTTTDDLS